jgi:hypothetical protein
MTAALPSPWLGGVGLGLVLAVAGSLDPAAGAASGQGVGAIVRSFCLSAFEAELARSGKTAPAGMADYACSCVADRIEGGSGLDEARASCRQATTRRFPI